MALFDGNNDVQEKGFGFIDFLPGEPRPELGQLRGGIISRLTVHESRYFFNSCLVESGVEKTRKSSDHDFMFFPYRL